MPNFYLRKKYDVPLPERENLLRALNHEKPLYMPCIETASASAPFGIYPDLPDTPFCDGYDWFGVFYKFSESQRSSTPQGSILPSGIREWRRDIKWPDMDARDWRVHVDEYHREPDQAAVTRYPCGLFEELHAFEGFEAALIDLITEPGECKAFFERMADHKIAVNKRLHDIYHFDAVYYQDDWGTSRGPFFAMDLFRETILEPTKRIVKTYREELGQKVIFHNCGLINDFVPVLVDEIHADALEIQSINDTAGILKEYGDRVTLMYLPDLTILYDPDTTPKIAREYAREVVDAYGAHKNPGAGIVTAGTAHSEEVADAYLEEIFLYSSKQYANL
jgi:hypothetical protein